MEVENVDDAHVHKRNISQIKNKKRRLEEYLKLKRAKQKLKRQAQKKRRKEAEALGENAPPKREPRTIENTREPDDTMVQADDEEVQLDEAMDEMAAYFRKEYVPKVLLTTSDNPHSRTIKFCRELKQSIPNTDFRWRNRSRIKKTVEHAIARGYSDIAVINEDRRHPSEFHFNIACTYFVHKCAATSARFWHHFSFPCFLHFHDH
uniref:Putative ribosome production factor 1 n=1 Tax=Rhipicephalus microplus TaxID=6941 RepID=A0A6M2CQD9_RHIMP